jgi:hypothetical protein
MGRFLNGLIFGGAAGVYIGQTYKNIPDLNKTAQSVTDKAKKLKEDYIDNRNKRIY